MPAPPRHHRQSLLPGVGDAGQSRLRNSHALLVGVGALGCAGADMLARAGVGRLTLIDRDIVEPTNLQRQTLYAESDLGKPKAHAAAERLRAVDSSLDIRPHAIDFTPSFARQLESAWHGQAPLARASGADDPIPRPHILLDGTDNFETRYLLNDLAVAANIPYVYAGVVATRGMVFAVLPGATPCLRCAFEDPPAVGQFETCDTAGVLGPAVMAVAAHQAAGALKILLGRTADVDRALLITDLWTNQAQRIAVEGTRPDCPCCGLRRFDWLRGESHAVTRTLCGRNSVQVSPGEGIAASRLDLDALARRLSTAAAGDFRVEAGLLRGSLPGERAEHDAASPVEITLFPNGRAIITGTTRPERARAIYARFVGS
jgi:adenylyltransferase/sulfurtransferase